MGEGAAKKGFDEYAVLPHQIKHHWEVIQKVLAVEKWSPQTFVEAVHEIRHSSLDTKKKWKTVEAATDKYKQLFLFLSDNEDFEGDEVKLWGGLEFKDHTVDARIKTWFVKYTVPHIAKLVLDLPTLFTSPVSILTTGKTRISELTLSKHQCASLLAASFFCAMHAQCQPLPRDDFQSMVNFDGMFYNARSNAKLFMIMNYFERTRLHIPAKDFTMTRLKMLPGPGSEEWCDNTTALSEFIVHETGGITETAPADVLHVDFANEYIGGGVLGGGAVQEEIMFSVCPELLVSLMFCSVMKDHEAILLIGAEKFCLHTGYNQSLKFAGNFEDVESSVSRVAMDATCYGWGRNKAHQWKTNDLLRDLNKAFVSFKHDYPFNKSAIATGNWGCGAFGGHVQLKSMLQWVAASACLRPVHYYTFRDPNAAGLAQVVEVLVKNSATVGQLMGAILDLADDLDLQGGSHGKTLFPYLIDHFSKSYAE